jgi:CRP-like cAMP-binding protein
MSLFSTGFSEPATKQALVDAELLNLSPTMVRHVAERDVRVARVFLVELSERARNVVHEIPGSAFASVRQRVARQLLDLASMRPGQPDELQVLRRLGGERRRRIPERVLRPDRRAALWAASEQLVRSWLPDPSWPPAPPSGAPQGASGRSSVS